MTMKLRNPSVSTSRLRGKSPTKVLYGYNASASYICGLARFLHAVCVLCVVLESVRCSAPVVCVRVCACVCVCVCACTMYVYVTAA